MKRSGNGGRRIVKSRESETPVDIDQLFKEAEKASQKREQEEEAKQLSDDLSSLGLGSSSATPITRPKRIYRRLKDKEIKEESPPVKEDSESDSEEPQGDDRTDDVKTSQDHLRCQYRKTVEKGIRTDLTKLGIAPEVIDLADQYYFDVTKGEIKRSNLRKGIMFACVFQAYKDLGKHQTPDYLQNLFKISRRVMSKGLTYFYPRSNKRSGDNGYITAEHFIPRIMETFNCKQEHIQAALRLYSQVKDKTTLFNSSNPQSVSSGLVYYYFKKINADIPGNTFGKAVGLSEITITRIASRIDEILSS
jgi:transcription initiation factor TFIIIB Brf1 subunit/transcription initiation factor TFIIB